MELLHHLSALAHPTISLCFHAPRALLGSFHCKRAAGKDRGQRLGLQEKGEGYANLGSENLSLSSLVPTQR